MSSTGSSVAVAALLVYLAAPDAAAQTTGGDEPALRADPVIVSLPGPDRPADELIGNASILDREDLVESLAGSLGDTLADRPGVSSTFFGAGASRPVLRGLGAERVLVLTNGLGVIDASAASPDHQVAADAIDAERIEILRGPAALAYGGEAIGGVVNVVDGLIAEERVVRPVSGDVFGAFNDVSEGTEAGGRVRFGTGPFVVTLTGSLRDFDSYEIPSPAESALQRAAEAEEDHDEDHDADHDLDGDHEHEEDHDHGGDEGVLDNSFVETGQIAGGLSWIGEGAALGIAVRRQTAEYGLPGHAHAHAHEEEAHGEDDHDHGEGGEEEEEEGDAFIDLEQTRYDLRGHVDLSAGRLTRLSGALSVAEYEHTEFEAPGEPGTRYETDGVEGRVELTHDLLFGDGTLGLQATDIEFGAFGEEAFITPTDSRTLGLFLYEAKEWDSGIGAEAGLRVEQVEYDNIVFGSDSFDLVSGSAGLHRHFDGGWFLGGQVSYTERAPNESELYADGPHLATNQFEVGDQSLDPERGLNFEATARWVGERFQVGTNLFVTDFEGFIYLAPGTTLEDGAVVDEADGLPVFVFTQENADFYGGEIYATWTPEGFLGAEWEIETGLDLVEADLETGGNVPLLPPVTFRTSVDAEWGPWEAGAAVTLADEQDDPGAGALPTDGYTRLDLRGEVDLSDFGFGRDGTELFVEARNVTDEEIRLATSTIKDLAPVPGRNVRVGLRVAF